MSCETKVPDTEPTSSDYRDAIQLAVGNEWLFEVIETDLKTGKTIRHKNTVIAIIDSFRIDGVDVYAMTGPTYFWERGVIDSAGYLLAFTSREILFSGVRLDETLFENYAFRVTMTDTDSVISVPVGTFKTVNYKREDKRTNEVSNHFYAKGIGLVKQVYINDNSVIEHNLIEYKVREK